MAHFQSLAIPHLATVTPIVVGPGGLQAPHPEPDAVHFGLSKIARVATAKTKLGVCVFGPSHLCFPHPEAWILPGDSKKANKKKPPVLHSRKIQHIYAHISGKSKRPPASEAKWASVLAKATGSALPFPPIPWSILYRNIRSGLLLPADYHQLSKLLHRGLFTNSQRSLPALKGCRLECHSPPPVEHMHHLASCGKTRPAREWALKLISAIDHIPPTPWEHGIVPLFCLGMAPPESCHKHPDGPCPCLRPLSKGAFTVLALFFRQLYAALTKQAIEGEAVRNKQIITNTATALYERISSYFASVKQD